MIPSKQNGTSNGTTSAADRDRLLTPARASSVNPVELNDLARELAAAFGNMVNSYRKHFKLSAEEATKRAAQTSPEHIDRILNAPPDGVSWLDLDALARKDESLAFGRWEQIKEAARDEIRSGYRAARAVEDGGGPWERARFLAVCAELTEAWRPCNAVEQLLVDQLAQWQVLLWRWQEALTAWTTHATYGPRRAKKGEPYETMRMSESEALERATEKVERLHRLYLRTLKALQDQWRPRPAVAEQKEEQGNVCTVRISIDSLALPSHHEPNAAGPQPQSTPTGEETQEPTSGAANFDGGVKKG
jgi:hypothetical protein